ncbi:MutS-related protein [Persicobacter diffluens]|uniref:DNA mismatch repair proteins mutS family domain-containing protein n=1 Tax=Persicobacter diffluens TaxID=981 RepID=A0AAN4W0I2_9BACT|nr:hypothetical protein PEDI_29250 [Persicobacter diffluens]
MTFLFLLLLITGSLAIFHFLTNRKSKTELSALKTDFANLDKVKPNPHDFRLYDRYFGDPHSCISAQTQQDLNYESVIPYINHCLTEAGSNYLYHICKQFQYEQKDGLTHYARFLQENTMARNELLEALWGLRKVKVAAFLKYLHYCPAHTPWYFNYAFISSFAFLSCLISGFYLPTFWLLLVPIFIINLLIHLSGKSFFTGLTSTLNTLRLLSRFHQKTRNNPELQRFIKKLDLKKINRISAIPLAFGPLSIENELAILFWYLKELLNIALLIEVNLAAVSNAQIRQHKSTLLSLFELTGFSDTALCLAYLKTKTGITESRIISDKAIYAEEIRHPLVKDCVPNSLTITQNMMLSGANMTGKSTLIRTMGINMLLSNNLGIAFAKTFHHYPFAVFSSMSIKDSLARNSSYFNEEVESLKHILEYPAAHKLILLDELFKGTNTNDRIHYGASVLNYLADQPHKIIISTHDLELENALNDAFRHFCMGFEIREGSLIFNYKLSGKTGNHQIVPFILQKHGFPEEILQMSHASTISPGRPSKENSQRLSRLLKS